MSLGGDESELQVRAHGQVKVRLQISVQGSKKQRTINISSDQRNILRSSSEIKK
jgi:hypothetical protein